MQLRAEAYSEHGGTITSSALRKSLLRIRVMRSEHFN
jgi:hypothetical protein